jgi:hypothetical protein
MKKILNGILVDMTADEIAARQAEETAWNNGAYDRAIADLRAKRNNLLAETDYHGISDMTMSSEMQTYRQSLRDLTNGLTTVEEVNSVVYPTKPE